MGYGKFFGIIGIIASFIAIFELIAVQKINSGFRLGSWDLFVGLSSIIVSGLAFGTAWFLRGTESQYTARREGSMLKQWMEISFIHTAVVGLFIGAVGLALNDQGTLRTIINHPFG